MMTFIWLCVACLLQIGIINMIHTACHTKNALLSLMLFVLAFVAMIPLEALSFMIAMYALIQQLAGK